MNRWLAALLFLVAAHWVEPVTAGGTTCTWTGASATSSNWSDAANWSGCVPTPSFAGQTLLFPNGAARRDNNNNLTGLSLSAVVISGPNYRFSGNTLLVTGSFVSNVNASVASDEGPVIDLPLNVAVNPVCTCQGNRALRLNTVELNGNLSFQTSCDIEVRGTIMGFFGLSKELTGTLILNSANFIGGPTTINAGTLRVRHPGGINGATVNSGAALQLDADVTALGALTLNGTAGGPSPLQAISGNSTWNGPITLAGTSTLDVAGGAQLTVGGGVSGSSLTKAGAGRLILTSSNAYSGGTVITGGTLEAASNASLGASSQPMTVASGGTLALQTGTYSGRTLTLDGLGTIGAGALQGLGANVLWDGPVILAGDTAMGAPLNGNLQITQFISGSASLNKVGAGTVIFGAANTYTGTTFVNAGSLTMTHSQALGSLAGGTQVGAGAALQIDGTLSVAESLALNGNGVSGFGALRNLGGNNTWAGPITLASDASVSASPNSSLSLAGAVDGSGLSVGGGGTLILSSNNTYAGVTSVFAGALRAQAGGALGTTTAGTVVGEGGRLELASGISVIGESLALGGDLHGASGVTAWNGPVTLNSDTSHVQVATGGTLTLGGMIDGAGLLEKRGLGTLVLAADNTYSGYTIVNAGTLVLQSPDALGLGGTAETGTVVPNGTTLQLSSSIVVANEHLILSGTGTNAGGGVLQTTAGENTWNGPVTLANDSTIGTASATALALNGDIAGSVALTKIGAGTLALGGNNSYTGQTHVNEGTLLLTGLVTSATVNSGARLTGDGDAGLLTLNAGGTVAPEGTLGAGDLTWNGGGVIALRLAPSAINSDRLALAGTLVKGSGNDFLFRFTDAPSGPPTPGVTYGLIGYDGTAFAPSDFRHTYYGQPGRNTLYGTFATTSSQAQFTLISVSLLRDGFESPP